MAKKIVVIGGSAAGPKAAAKARRMDESADITIVQKGKDLSMASCGYPYFVGGVFDDRKMLICTPTGVVRDPNFFMAAKNIDARVQTEALSIDRKAKRVACRNLVTGETYDLDYDSLILATGATPNRPPVPGIDLDGVTTLQSMEDADYLRSVRDAGKIKKAVVIGGGLIGIETCEALHLAGIEITVIDLLPQLLTFLDWEMAQLVENHVRAKGVNVIINNGLAAFLGEGGKLTGVKLSNGIELPCELAVLAVGVRPNVALGKAAGLKIGERGGILVDEHMRSSDDSIFAVGDCVEMKNLVTGKQVYAPYGDVANLQGRVAGRNTADGEKAVFPGVIQTGICKIFEFAAGTTGLNERSASDAGIDYITVVNSSPDKPPFMGGLLLVTKLLADRATGRILGAQCVGPGDVSKQLAIWAMAIMGKLHVEEMVNADLPYAPPFSLAIDHSIATAHLMQNKIEGRLKGVSVTEVRRALDAGENPLLLDVRGPDEYEAMRLGAGEVLIPLGILRKRLNELPEDKKARIICYCKIALRGYEAALILEANGWKNVQVMEGGIMAWPYPREK